ncbi:MAG: hypothetical protein LBC83_06290 [Oscillospiraceae bacterium]|nr:hypothetical protein [Oscillospiraceae bacterium]
MTALATAKLNKSAAAPRMRRLRESGLWLASFGCVACIVLLVLYSPAAAAGAREGLLICGQVVLPTLFPFFVLSALFATLLQRKATLRSSTARLHGLRVMERLFRQPAAAAGVLLIGLLGGYPMGAKAAAQLFERSLLTRRQAQCLQLFCFNAGPAFLIGVVGSALLGSREAGLLAFASLSLASLALGLGSRLLSPAPGALLPPATTASNAQSHTRTLTDSTILGCVTQGVAAALNVCAWVILFSCVCALLQFLPAGLRPAIPAANAMLEVSSGVVQAVRAGMPLPVLCAVLGWGGLSVHCQILGDLRKVGLRLRWFWTARALHGGLAAAICSQLMHWFPPDTPTALTLGSRSVQLWAISAPAAAALLLFCAFLILDLDLNRKIC